MTLDNANGKTTHSCPSRLRVCLLIYNHRLEEELARLEWNRERRIQREKAKAIDASAPDSDDSKPIQQTKGTQRKCANCGQVGHIKTNKRYANSLLVNPNLLNSISRGRLSLVITFLLDSVLYSMARSRTQRSRLMRLDSQRVCIFHPNLRSIEIAVDSQDM
jgi:hypothetical protein